MRSLRATRLSILSAAAVALLCSSAAAGPNANGRFVVHHDATLEYSSACDSIPPVTDCESLTPTAVADGTDKLWFVFAAFPSASSQVGHGFVTYAFGLSDYDPSDLIMSSWGVCSDDFLEITVNDWPGPDSGTSVVSTNCETDLLVPIYWFVTRAYASSSIGLTLNPTQDQSFVTCWASSRVADVAVGFGTMGFGEAGSNPCP